MKKRIMPRWTDAEEVILRKYYPTEGRNVAARLKRRSVEQCKRKANYLGLHYTGRGPWSPEEEEIVRKYYPTEGAKTLKRLPGRTRAALTLRAQELSVRCVRRNRNGTPEWTEAEEAILRQYYPEEGASGVKKRLPERSLKSCRKHASALGVHKNVSNRFFWTPNRDNILRQYWGAITNDKICDILGLMNPEALYRRAKQLGLERQERKERVLAKTYGRYVRRCHTCGKPTDGSYWCRECKEERLRRAGWSPREIVAALGEDKDDADE